MPATPWICRSCIKSLARSSPTRFLRLASTTAVNNASLPQILLTRAQKLADEHDTLQSALQNGFDSAKAKRAGELSSVASALRSYQAAQASIRELAKMLDDPDQDDADLAAIARDEMDGESRKLAALGARLGESLTPKHPFAELPCLIEIRPGPGGLEGRYFADTLCKMYQAFCSNMGYRCAVVKYEMSDTAGSMMSPEGENPLQEAILEITDPGSYGIFKTEAGMHRVQRIPSTEAKGRVHTSAVAVWVLPSSPAASDPTGSSPTLDLDNPESEFYLNPADVKVEKMRASGAGGQHVNKTESAIRLTHVPTGTSVSMQDSRSQSRNRDEAWRILRARLADLRREQKEEEQYRLRDSVLGKGKTTRGDKIRTYNYGQDRCTDHRAGVDVHNLPGVLAGGEGLGRVMDRVREWSRERDIEVVIAEEEAAAAKDAKR